MSVLLVFCLAAALGTPQERPRFAAEVESVSIDVFVTRDGRAVPGLGARDFEVRDEGVLQEVEVVDLSASPLGAVLAFDTSGSMFGKRIEGLRAAARAFIGGLDARDEAALVTFSSHVGLQLAPTTDRRRFLQALEATQARGSTALFDGLYAALRLPLASPRRLVLLFSDGVDNVSVLEAPDVRHLTALSDVLVYAVTMDERDPPTAPNRPRIFARGSQDDGDERRREPAARRELRLLAEATGGRLLDAASPGDLAPQFLRILDDLRTRYVISFTPRGVAREGLHRLDVRVKARDVRVRARRSYRVPVRRP